MAIIRMAGFDPLKSAVLRVINYYNVYTFNVAQQETILIQI